MEYAAELTNLFKLLNFYESVIATISNIIGKGHLIVFICNHVVNFSSVDAPGL